MHNPRAETQPGLAAYDSSMRFLLWFVSTIGTVGLVAALINGRPALALGLTTCLILGRLVSLAQRPQAL